MAIEHALATNSATCPMSGEELFEIGDTGRSELVKGEIVYMAPTGFEHGIIENRFGTVLRNFVDSRKLGQVMTGEVGIYTQRNPDTVRGADVIYISADRLSKAGSGSYLDVAPELIVEIMSPGDRWQDINDKLEEYFSIGVDTVWIADPRGRQMLVYRTPTEAKKFSTEDMISGGDILPGFEIRVGELFGGN